MIRMSIARAAAAAATLALVGVGVVAIAPTAAADTLTCLAPATGLQYDNNQAIQDDQAGNPAAAASLQAGDLSRETSIMSTCYYNPSVPYSAYTDVASAFIYIDSAHTANNAGNTGAALSAEQTVAHYLSDAVRLLNIGP